MEVYQIEKVHITKKKSNVNSSEENIIKPHSNSNKYKNNDNIKQAKTMFREERYMLNVIVYICALWFL